MSAEIAQNRENFEFGGGRFALKRFLQNFAWGGSHRSAHYPQI